MWAPFDRTDKARLNRRNFEKNNIKKTLKPLRMLKLYDIALCNCAVAQIYEIALDIMWSLGFHWNLLLVFV